MARKKEPTATATRRKARVTSAPKNGGANDAPLIAQEPRKKKSRNRLPAPFKMFEVRKVQFPEPDGKPGKTYEARLPIDHPTDFDSAWKCQQWVREHAEEFQGRAIEIMQLKEQIVVRTEMRVQLIKPGTERS